MDPNEIDVIFPRRGALRNFLKCSPVTAWRREQTDPDWPKAIQIGPGRFGYRMSDIKRYLDSRRPRERAA
jgi:predicted DNA-binding transcriptional regulator AlpA